MPTRKQRRRRQKDFRHDVRVFEVDEEGNEIPIAELRTREEASAPAKSGTTSKKQQPSRGGGRTRAVREVPAPSWERALRRGGIMGGVMLFAFVFLFRDAPIALRIAWGGFYALAFIPLTYWIDRMAHRSYLRRLARQSAPKTDKKR